MTKAVNRNTDYYLYRNFLSDPAAYARAEALLREHWQELPNHAKDRVDWKAPWLSTGFADATPCRDGNPISSAVCPQRRRGIRVIQVQPSAEPRELHFWIDTFDDGGPIQIDELVISCALTRGTLIDAMNLVSQGVNEGEIELSQEPIPTTEHI
jgi:hypothetical protein